MGGLLFGQADPSGEPRDVVVLLDTSASMSAFYREVSAFSTGPLLREFLRLADTLHLISFSDKPRLELSRRVEGQGDLEVVIGRMLLLYPVEPYSDIIGALAYTEGYVSTLPGKRPKTILVISDGEHNPSPGSPSIPEAGLQGLLRDMQNRLQAQGIRFEFIQVPEGLKRNPPVSAPPQAVPSSQAPVPPAPSLPSAPEPSAPPASALQMPVLVPELSVPEEEAPYTPPENEPGYPTDTAPYPDESWGMLPEYPRAAEPPEWIGEKTQDVPQHNGAQAANKVPLLMFINTSLGFLAVVIVLIILGLLSRKLAEAPKRMLAHGTESADLEGPPMIALFVKDQSAALGRRNLHILKAGYSLSLGGGNSDFLIFLVPVPPRIARVYFDGISYFFIPQKPQFFPDLGGQVLPDCIGKTIRIITDKNYELSIRIERREDPWYALSRLLASVTLP
ncbi:MAG: VWA domain-containing protein [Spirochaetaceae bacterium]|jgi:hypothetical protein|nr:VWA domain-containing protein [Spirochaetaceae bacterium]